MADKKKENEKLVLIQIRIAPAQKERVEKLAEQLILSEQEVIRLLLSLGYLKLEEAYDLSLLNREVKL